MANKKFSEFTVKTSTSDVDFVVGYDGTDNVRITPANLTGGGGASSLNGLTDCLVDTNSLYVGEVPSSLSGNPQGNTILGIDAGNSNTSGTENTNIGYQAGYSNATGTNRVCVGYEAGKNGTGNTGVFVGALAGQGSGTNNGTGSVGIGWGALRSYSTGNNNVAIGFQAARSVGSGVSDCVIIGGTAGYSNSGSSTVLIGKDAGRNNTATGSSFIGYQAGYSNTSATRNTNIGYEAGYSSTTGGSNTNIGYQSGKNVTGIQNTFIGDESGVGVSGSSTAFGNIGIGFQALKTITTGGNNVAIGLTMGSPTAGSQNTLVGVQTSVGNTFESNITSIGYQASGNGSSNVITLGNSSVTTLRCQATSITSLSDARDKKDIKDLEYGLNFIDSLQPREFVWDNRAETDIDGNEYYSNNKGEKDFGFIAQEVKEIDNDTLKLVNDTNLEKLELSYGKLVPILVKAIQELKAEIELLKS
mgnify:CR=1 FL=1